MRQRLFDMAGLPASSGYSTDLAGTCFLLALVADGTVCFAWDSGVRVHLQAYSHGNSKLIRRTWDLQLIWTDTLGCRVGFQSRYAVRYRIPIRCWLMVGDGCADRVACE